MREPVFQGAPTERTEIRLAYDKDYFYVAARCYDSAPSRIQTVSLERDGTGPTNDAIYFILDTFDDKENALAFGTTPAGIRGDFVVFNDAQGDFPIDVTWDAFWDVAVTRSDSGWSAEFRLPFSSLRFREEEGRVKMGFSIMCHIPRKNEWITFPAIPTKWGFWGMFKPSIAQEVVFEDVHSRNPVYLTPYTLNGLGQSFALNQLKTRYKRIDDPTSDLGADLKYSPTSNLTLDLTLNTDFAQVEADEQQVNLTRFSFFFPEKRLFFQERSSIFTFATGQNDRLFYSRRIGLTEEGELTRIYGGARAVGRVGSWDVGFLDMQTAAQGTQPSENFGVLRQRQQVINPNSYLGGMATSRIGRDGTYNAAYGLDGNIRCLGDDYLSYNWAQTFQEGQHPSPATGLGRVQWERRTIEGLGYALGAAYAGPDYDPGMGFVTRTDYTSLEGRLGYGWNAGQTSPFLRQRVSLSGFAVRRNHDGAIESAELLPQWSLERKSGAGSILRLRVPSENLREPFSLSDQAEVPAGRYTLREGNDLYLVYNEVLGVDRAVAVPMLPLSESRALLAKYTYTFQFSGGVPVMGGDVFKVTSIEINGPPARPAGRP